MQDAVRRQAAGLDRLDDRAPPLGGSRIGGDAEQAREQRRERPPRLDLAEVEHLHAVAGDAARARGIHERFEQPRLADACLAAGDDRPPAPRRHAAVEQGVHQRQLGVAARERQVVHAERAAQPAREQHFARVCLARERLGIAHGVARERERPVDAGRQQRALRDAGRRRAGREVARADRVDDRLRRAQRPLRFVAREVLEPEHRDQPVSREPVRDAAVMRDRLVEESLQPLRQLACFFRVERAALRGEARQAHRQHDARLQHAVVRCRGRGRFGGERRGDLVFGFRTRHRVQRPAGPGATLLHQLAIERLGRGIRRQVELAPQQGAQDLVLAQRLGVAAGARIAGHEFAMHVFGERLERQQPGLRIDLAVAIPGIAAERGKLRGCGRKFASQRAALGGCPFLEGARSGVEALEQRLGGEPLRLLQRVDGRLREQCAQPVHVDLHEREVERDLLRVRFDERLHLHRQRTAQRRQRLAQARAREFGVRVLPEQRGEAIATLRRAVLQREEGEQGAGLAGRDPQRPVARAPEFETSEQSQPQHGRQAYPESKGDVTFKSVCPLLSVTF